MVDPPKPCVSSDAASEIARLHQLVDEQRVAIRARDDFIAIAAHELRNPMTPILGVAQLAYAAALQSGTTLHVLAPDNASVLRLPHGDSRLH